MLSYEFKNFKHYFNVFWWEKKQPFEKNTRKSTAVVKTKKSQKNQKLISLGQMMEYSSFF